MAEEVDTRADQVCEALSQSVSESVQIKWGPEQTSKSFLPTILLGLIHWLAAKILPEIHLCYSAEESSIPNSARRTSPTFEKPMFWCLILLASSILAPGQSAPSHPHKAAHKPHLYQEHINKVDDFDKHFVAPLIQQVCEHHVEIHVVENEEKPFNALKQRCETALFLHGMIEQINGEFTQQKANRNFYDDDMVLGNMFEQMKDKVLNVDVKGLKKHFLITFFKNETKERKVAEINEYSGFMSGSVSAYANMKKEFENALNAFKEDEQNIDTAYSMLDDLEEMSKKSMAHNVLQNLDWTKLAFEAVQLVYDFLQTNEQKLEKKHGTAGTDSESRA